MASSIAIFAGGKSRRMGQHKAKLLLKGRPVLDYIYHELTKLSEDILIIGSNEKVPTHFQDHVTEDIQPGLGPLAGLETALSYAKGDVVIVSACDTPFVSATVCRLLLDQLSDFDAIVPKYNGRIHPLSGIYHCRILPEIQAHIHNDKLKLTGLLESINVNYMSDFNDIEHEVLARHFFNMNAPEDYQLAQDMFFK